MKGTLLLCLVAAFAPLTLGSLIVGGHQSVANSRPYQAALFSSKTWQFCGGTLVGTRWVVSAAHCAGGTVYVGLGYHLKYSHDNAGQQYIKGGWKVHPNYNTNTIDNDISLIELSSDADIGTDVKSKIQKIGISSVPPKAGQMLLVSGWGTESSGDWDTPVELREVAVATSSDSTCMNAYPGGITNNMFCAASPGKDACQGDSGGPIVSDYGVDSHSLSTVLKGIVSWGRGCAWSGFPGVYTKVSNYCDWISTTTKSAVKCV